MRYYFIRLKRIRMHKLTKLKLKLKPFTRSLCRYMQCKYTYTHIYHTYIQTYTHAHTYTCAKHVYMPRCMYTHIYICIPAIHTFTRTHTYIHTYIYIYTYIYTRIYYMYKYNIKVYFSIMTKQHSTRE